jgi:hypothetical protein
VSGVSRTVAAKVPTATGRVRAAMVIDLATAATATGHARTVTAVDRAIVTVTGAVRIGTGQSARNGLNVSGNALAGRSGRKAPGGRVLDKTNRITSSRGATAPTRTSLRCRMTLRPVICTRTYGES